MYKLYKDQRNGKIVSVFRTDANGQIWSIPFASDNTDYQTFKTAVLEQQPGGAVVEDGDSFSLNTNPNDSILEDANGVQMTIDQAKEYVRTLP
jgi:hypothetical protein